MVKNRLDNEEKQRHLKLSSKRRRKNNNNNKERERIKKVKETCGTQSGETVSTLVELQNKRERDKYI